MKCSKYYLLLLLPMFWACQSQDKKVAHVITPQNDTLSYHYDSLRMTSPILRDSFKQDSAYASVSYPVFEQTEISTFIEKAIANAPVNNKKVLGYADIAKDFIDNYNQYAAEQPEILMPWFMDLKVTVRYQKFNYMAIEKSYADFQGGAHGNYYFHYLNFNPKILQPITLDSLIAEGKQKDLLRVAEDIFRKDEQLSPTEKLDNRYIFDNGKFYLPDNFYLTDKSLVFLYNIYEIKPYSEGTTSINIPFSLLKNIAKPNSILSAVTDL